MSLCRCGCGESAPLASRTSARRGTVTGEPIKFIRGHNARAPRPEQVTPVADRFWPQVVKTEGCWEWSGNKRNGGYGYAYFNGKNRAAHRIAYELAVGPIPDGLILDHLCRNTGCVRPEHLEPVTNAENVLRGYVARSRGAS